MFQLAVRTAGDVVFDLSLFVSLKLVVVNVQGAFIGGLEPKTTTEDESPYAFAVFVGADAVQRATESFDKLCVAIANGRRLCDLSQVTNPMTNDVMAALGVFADRPEGFTEQDE
jgi:hypothetical protein